MSFQLLVYPVELSTIPCVGLCEEAEVLNQAGEDLENTPQPVSPASNLVVSTKVVGLDNRDIDVADTVQATAAKLAKTSSEATERAAKSASEAATRAGLVNFILKIIFFLI